MNRNKDGTELTFTQLIDIAKAAGFTDRQIQAALTDHGIAMQMSNLRQLTQEARLTMFNRRELTLDTRTATNVV